ncbi:MAG: energy transducer TonB [Gammaproteobacteria bacterium]
MRSMTGSIILPRPPLRLIAVAALHVALIYTVNDALRFEWPEPADERVTARLIPQKPKPPAVVTGGGDPTTTITVKPTAPPPRVPIDDPVDSPPVESPTRAVGPVDNSSGSAGVELRITPVRADPRYPLTRADYPAVSIRGGEEGVVELSVYVLRDGRIADVRVARSSGHARLDRAAVEEARRRWRMQPALRGDEPTDAWGNFRVVFRIETH